MTGISLPAIGFGTAPLGGLFSAVTTDEALLMLEDAWEAGIRYFDTAPHYGQGRAERVLGDFLRGKDPATYTLSTKVGRILTRSSNPQVTLNSFVTPLPFDQSYDYSYDGIMRSVEDSYQRLGLIRIDVVLVHDIGRYTHGSNAEVGTRQLLDSGERALRDLRASGEVDAVGIGVNEVEICERLIGNIPLDILLLAGRYTLLDRTAETHLLPRCLDHHVQVVIGGIFNSGILVSGATPDARWNYSVAPRTIRDEVTALDRLCRRFGLALASAALAFPGRHPAVSTILLGCGSRTELHECLQWLQAMRNQPPPEAFWQDMQSLGLKSPCHPEATRGPTCCKVPDRLPALNSGNDLP